MTVSGAYFGVGSIGFPPILVSRLLPLFAMRGTASRAGTSSSLRVGLAFLATVTLGMSRSVVSSPTLGLSRPSAVA